MDNSLTNLLEILPGYDKTTPKIPYFTIYYATQSNMAKKFADKIADDAKILNLNCTVKNISEISLDDFNRNVLILFMVSTYGEGGPSDDCIEFNKLLEDKSRGKYTFFDEFNNNSLNYGIFGLGSSKYEYFNQMAKKLDTIFGKNTMNRICEVGLGDDSKNINEDFQTWRKMFWTRAQQYFTENYERINKVVEEKNLKEFYEGTKEEIEITLGGINAINEIENKTNIVDNSNIDINEYEFNLKRFLQADQCKISEIAELRKENINGSTLKITYSLDNTSLKYNVGDNIGVYPTNSESQVSSLITRLNYNPDLTVNIKKLKQTSLKKKISIVNGSTVKDLLLNIVDLSCHVNKELVEKFLKFCFDEDQYEALQNTLKKENKLKDFLAKNYSIVDFLSAYDSINLPFVEFYNIMPKITPRFYTVASSPNYTKGKLEIIISLLEWKGVNNQTRYGLTSNYYKNAFENFKKSHSPVTTRLIVRESNFKIPANPDHPIIMICTGTGIAPYISFFQEYENKLNQNIAVNAAHNNVLIFGSKNRKYDFIYENEITNYNSKNIINKLYTAFSRDQDSKIYVQDVIRQNIGELEEFINNGITTIFICGGVSMGAEVVSTLEKHFTRDFVKQMEADNRLIKELWG